jgi:hypothetical protein
MKRLLGCLLLILLGTTLLLYSCKENDMGTNEIDWEELKKYTTTIDNSIDFSYNPRTKITTKKFNGLTTVTGFEIAFPGTILHQNQDEYYTVYSLKKNKLAYVVFHYSAYTGVTFYLNYIIEYPYASEEDRQKLWFLLEKDLPENIMKNSGS